MVLTVEKPIRWTQPRLIAQKSNQSQILPQEWEGLKPGKWTEEIDVRDFIQKNYTPYERDGAFLAEATERTQTLWGKVRELMKEEGNKGILEAETKIPSGINAYGAGYIDRDLEQIVGLQTDKPLKRAIVPYGGIRVVKKSLEAYGYQLDPETEKIFTKYRKTHNDGVFDAYTPEMLAVRRSGLITGLPDAWSGSDYW